MRLIDADALMKNIESIPWFTKTKNGYLVSGAKSEVGSYLPTDKVWEAVNKAHTVDAKPLRHGRWCQDEEKTIVLCSECLFMKNFRSSKQNYCPNCGAKMDSDRE